MYLESTLHTTLLLLPHNQIDVLVDPMDNLISPEVNDTFVVLCLSLLALKRHGCILEFARLRDLNICR